MAALLLTASAAPLAALATGSAPSNAPAAASAPTAALAPPQALFQELFVAVQTARLFEDQKIFPDAIPDEAPDRILEQYRTRRPALREELTRFVQTNFAMPAAVRAAPGVPERFSIDQHIDRLWDSLTRTAPAVPYSSALPLPYPYVVPGGRFREIYYWDSYFTMLGLAESHRLDLVQDMVDDFAYLIDSYGHIPNGSRTYYLSRSQPPFFFDMVGLIARDDPPAAFARYLPQLKAEYAFWMQGAKGLRPGSAHRRVVVLSDGSILNRYWDDLDTPRDESYAEDVELARGGAHARRQLFREIRAAAESGWDFSSRWFADARTRATLQTTAIVPIDLNALLFGLENAISAGSERAGDPNSAREFAYLAAQRRSAIDRYLWDAQLGAYLDYQWVHRRRIRRVSAATLYPLFVALASADQAAAVARVTTRQLLEAGGLVTTRLKTGQQWDAPNGWAPLQWVAIEGLRRYHQDSLAETIACRWMRTVNELYRQNGTLVEKYDVMTIGRRGGGGEYPLQDGFGWTNGVMRKLMALYPRTAAASLADECAADTLHGD